MGSPENAQRRPGAYPRRHARAFAASTTPFSSAQRRPGAYPRRHSVVVSVNDSLAPNAQRRPGAYPRRHPPPRRAPCWRRHPLNEGRELIPGDTRQEEDGPGDVAGRSTKAGSLSPATLRGRQRERLAGAERSTKAGSLSPATHAQGGEDAEAARRSTKAGSLSPATRPQRDPARGRRGRSTKAGSLSPATLGHVAAPSRKTKVAQRRPGAYPRRHSPSRPRSTSPPPLNEGRELIPGDTGQPGHHQHVGRARSTKAGSLSPATRVAALQSICQPLSLNEGRELIPGDTSYGNMGEKPPKNPLNEGRELIPGDTSGRGSQAGRRRCALNEGRELIPGDTSSRLRLVCTAMSAQRRPGAYPRRHRRRVRRRRRGRGPLNEGRELIPGDTSVLTRCFCS